MNQNSKRPFWAIPGAIALISIFAVTIIYGLFIEQPCNGIDKTSLWCYLHPLTTIKLVCIAFSAAGIAFQAFYWIAFSKEKNKDGTPAKDGGDNAWLNAGGLIAFILFFILAVVL